MGKLRIWAPCFWAPPDSICLYLRPCRAHGDESRSKYQWGDGPPLSRGFVSLAPPCGGSRHCTCLFPCSQRAEKRCLCYVGCQDRNPSDPVSLSRSVWKGARVEFWPIWREWVTIYGSDGETGGVVRFRGGSRSQAPAPVTGSVPREHWGHFGFCGASL